MDINSYIYYFDWQNKAFLLVLSLCCLLVAPLSMAPSWSPILVHKHYDPTLTSPNPNLKFHDAASLTSLHFP